VPGSGIKIERCHKKSPVEPGLVFYNNFFITNGFAIKSLFDFGFFIHHVLAHHGIKFFDLHFFGHGALVFGGGVKVACACG
jgi:hypothetical protein